MKNRVTKLLLLVLSLALLVGGAVGISVSAENAAPEIISKNVMDTGDFCLMFAVDPATVAGEDVTLRVYDRDPSEQEAKLAFEETKAKTATEDIDLDGDRTPETAVIVFTTAGVAAKDFADVWYIETESAGAKKVITYSVMEYAFERLYRDGAVLASEEDADLYSYYQKEFYFGMLDMGSAAQNLHVNYGKAEAERERLVKEYTYVSVLDGTFTAGEATADRGFVEANTSITLNANDTEAIKGWSIFTYGQNGVEIDRKVANDGDTITVTGNTVVIPYEIGVTAGKYFDEIGDSAYTMDGWTWKDFIGNGGNNYVAHTNFSKNSCAYLLKDSGFEKYGAIIGGSKPSVESGETGTQTLLHFPIYKTTSESANCVVFEYDFYYNGADVYYNNESDTDSGTVYFLMNSDDLTSSSGKSYNTLTKTLQKGVQTIDLDGVKAYDETSTKYKSAKGENALRLPGVTDSKYDLLANTWYRITYEVYTDANTCLVYIDGVCVGSFATATGKTVADYNTASLMFDARFRNVEFYVDNVCGAKICKEYKAPN
ncbi:MAG: hypothetical protein IJ488_00310 [Clostridia bacterium]|nr:hypothetical protein [Clostridia bacterium]